MRFCPYSRILSEHRYGKSLSYLIEFTEDAKNDLCFFKAQERRIILYHIRNRLSHEPARESRNRKRLRVNPVAAWELRVARYRIFYEVTDNTVTVGIIAIGWKKHNILYIRGKEVIL